VDVTNSNIVISGQITCTPQNCTINETSITSSNFLPTGNPTLSLSYTFDLTINYDQISNYGCFVYAFDTLSIMIIASGYNNYLSTEIMIDSNDYVKTWVVKNNIELLDMSVFNQAGAQIEFKYVNLDSSSDQNIFTEIGDKIVLANDDISNNNYNIVFFKGCGKINHLEFPDDMDQLAQFYFELNYYLNNPT
jgi:hypothetical protein